MQINYIDILKDVAIIAVVLYHAGLMTYGCLGVDLFLVIAGYHPLGAFIQRYCLLACMGGQILSKLRDKTYYETSAAFVGGR